MRIKRKKIISDWIDLINGALRPNEIVELPVLSGSMMPILQPGKHIKIKYMPPYEIKTGDIIIFKDNNLLTAHRALMKISIANKVFIYQKGDTNRFGSWITGEKIIGTVISAQNNKNIFIDLTAQNQKKLARILCFKNIRNVILDSILILPRKIKWLLKIS